MDLTWSAVIQSIILAICTWYVRRGSKKDSESVKRTTEIHDKVSESKSNEINDRLKRLESDMEFIKHVLIKNVKPVVKPGLVDARDTRHN